MGHQNALDAYLIESFPEQQFSLWETKKENPAQFITRRSGKKREMLTQLLKGYEQNPPRAN